MQFRHVTLEFDGQIAVLKFDHPEVMNAVSMDMLGGLGEALDAIEDRRSEVRCLVISGTGRAFCAGANLQGRNNAETGKRTNAGAALKQPITRSCAACAICIARLSPRSMAPPPAPV